MKRSLLRVFYTCLLGAVSTVPGFGALLSILPTTNAVSPGASVALSVQISNIGGNAVGDYDITVGYNPAILSASSIAFNGFLGGPLDSLQSTSITPGSAEFAEVSLLSTGDLIALQPNAFLLATITFKAISGGNSVLQFSSAHVDDGDANPIAISLLTASVTVAAGAVPESSAMWQFVSVLIAVFLYSRVRARFSRAK